MPNTDWQLTRRSKPNDETIRFLYQGGLSSRTVAWLMGSSCSTVCIICRDITRSKSVAALLARPAKSKHWRSSRAAARKKMERRLGVKLPREIHVHHKDDDYTNNADDNLELKAADVHTVHHMQKKFPEHWKDGELIPRHLRPDRQAYMKKYFKTYRKGEDAAPPKT